MLGVKLIVHVEAVGVLVAVTVKFFRTPVLWRDCGLMLKQLAIVNTSPTAMFSVAVPPYICVVVPVKVAEVITIATEVLCCAAVVANCATF